MPDIYKCRDEGRDVTENKVITDNLIIHSFTECDRLQNV